MSATLYLLLSALISVSLSAIVLRTLSAPLAKLLDRVCPDEQVGAFWLRYTQLMLTIAPLLVALTFNMFSNTDRPLDALRLTLMASLAGLLLGLYVVGRRLVPFIQAPRTGSAS